MPEWLEIHRGDAPLIVAFPHTGTDIPVEVEARMVSPWLARRDTDWHVEKLYEFARDLGATTVRTAVSRSAIDVNRDPSGQSLYPGQATTDLCPVETFSGEPLYAAGDEPGEPEIAGRREALFEPYHAALTAEIERLREYHPRIVLYDAHSICSRIPRLFDGELPHLNIGDYDGRSCAPELTRAVVAIAEASEFSSIVDGRFKGGWTTRRYGVPDAGVHAIQMELACRAYLDEPDDLGPDSWPVDYDPARAADLRAVLGDILTACMKFAESAA